jgi:hypothetical protein
MPPRAPVIRYADPRLEPFVDRRRGVAWLQDMPEEAATKEPSHRRRERRGLSVSAGRFVAIDVPAAVKASLLKAS